jgi:hypothetical protein
MGAGIGANSLKGFDAGGTRSCPRSAFPGGVEVRQIVPFGGLISRLSRCDDPTLRAGWHGFEADNAWRWTDGDATVPPSLLAGFTGSVEVVVQVGMTTVYWDDGQACRVA